MPLPDGCYRTRNDSSLTWVKKANGDWLMPADIGLWDGVGWSVIDFAEKWTQIDGKPAVLTNEQQRMLHWASAVNPETLRFEFPVTAWVRLKGHSKDYLQAVTCLHELVGLCRPKRLPDGRIGLTKQPNPWVVVASTSLEATATTSKYFREILTDKAIERYGIDLGKEITFTADGGKLESVTAQPRRIEGNRPTFLSGSELGLWIPSTGGPDLWLAMERGSAKIVNTRIVGSSNAYAQGQGSVLELLHKDFIAQEEGTASAEASRVNYDQLSAPKGTDPSDPVSLRAGIEHCKGDSWWLDVDRKMAVALSRRTSLESTLRFELVTPAAPDDAMFDTLQWEACEDAELALKPRDRITLGLDVSLKDDATALVAVRVSDRAAFLLALAEKPLRGDDTWSVNIEEFDHAIAEAFRQYRVVGFYSDVNPIQGHVERWNREYGDKLLVGFSTASKVAADMRASQRRFILANESLVAAIEFGQIHHNGDSRLRRHVLNVYRRMTRFGLSFGKRTPDSAQKVDAYAALLLADLARSDYLLAAPAPVKKRRRSSVGGW